LPEPQKLQHLLSLLELSFQLPVLLSQLTSALLSLSNRIRSPAQHSTCAALNYNQRVRYLGQHPPDFPKLPSHVKAQQRYQRIQD
jgi:hypothetical protein